MSSQEMAIGSQEYGDALVGKEDGCLHGSYGVGANQRILLFPRCTLAK
jgi:hypothetical protein